MQDQEREEPRDLGFRRERVLKRSSEPQRQSTNVSSDRRGIVGRPIPLDEEQVDRRQNRFEPTSGIRELLLAAGSSEARRAHDLAVKAAIALAGSGAGFAFLLGERSTRLALAALVSCGAALLTL